LPGFRHGDAAEPELDEREREPDAVAGGYELLGEEDDPDLAEQVERPGDRARDKERG
jgi:hypothetical protein